MGLLWNTAIWDNLEAERNQEIRKGKVRFSEDFSEGVSGSKELPPKNILIANLLRVYHENAIALSKGVPHKAELELEQTTLQKILALLYGFSNIAKISIDDVETLLNSKSKAKRYLILFAKECPPELKNKLLVYTLDQRCSELPDNHKKRQILHNFFNAIEVTNEEWIHLNSKRTGKLLAFFDIQDAKALAGKYKSYQEEAEFNLTSSSLRAETYENESVESYIKRMAGLAATAYRTLTSSFFNRQTAKESANQYLREFFKSKEASDVAVEENYVYIEVLEKALIENMKEDAVYVYKEGVNLCYGVKGPDGNIVQRVIKKEDDVGTEMGSTNENKLKREVIIELAKKKGDLPTISNSYSLRAKSQRILQELSDGQHNRIMQPFKKKIETTHTYLKHKANNNHEAEDGLRKEARAMAIALR
jgi:hypothetical protein